MLAPFREQIKNMRVILGSQSPRRRELLANIIPKYEVIPSQFDESTISPDMFPNPSEFVRVQSQKKCEELIPSNQDADLIITADTIVFVDNKILGKPGTHERAYEMIKQLNGRSHTVETGVYLAMPKKNKFKSFSVSTQVYFADLSDEIIRAYADSDDPLDKAGAYGYQAGAMSLVTKIDGDYPNVIGLPIHQLAVEIAKLLSE